MVIYDLAMKLKLEGEEFYSIHSETEEDEGVRQIFKILAADERRQYEIIKKAKDRIPSYESSDVLNRARKLFLKKGLFTGSCVIRQIQLDILKDARKRQEDCLYIYRRLVDEVTHDFEKDIFKSLVRDAEDHIAIIQNISEYL